MKHFIHDCNKCLFHGHMQGYDVYICNNSVILRFGNLLHEYESFNKTVIGNLPGKWQSVQEFISSEPMV